MYERSERYKNPLKRSFRKAEKATVAIMFGKLWFVLVLGPVGPQGPLGRRFIGTSPVQRLMVRRTRTLLPTHTKLLKPQLDSETEAKLAQRKQKQ